MTNRRTVVALVAALMVVAYYAPQVQAADATGTWKWTQQGRGGRRGAPGGGGAGGGGPATQPGGGGGGGRGGAPVEITAMLKQDGEKLTGSIMGMTPADPTAKTDISDGTIKADGTLEFKVTTTGGRGPITRIYKGKLDGDKITGTSEFDFGGAAPGGGAPGGGAPGGGAPGGGAPGGGGGRGFGGPQPWEANRAKM